MTSIHTELLHFQFFVSPSAPGSENQYGLNRLRTPPIRLNAEVTPAAGGKAPTQSSTVALPVVLSYMIASAPMGSILASINNRFDPSVMPPVALT